VPECEAVHVDVQDLTPALWPSLERLFGDTGASCGCWCMFWRLTAAQPFASLRGPPLKRRFKAKVGQGGVLGALAFVDKEPVGWVTYGPRPDFPRLERSSSLACDDAAEVWSVPCFFIKQGFRNQGVASRLLSHALVRMEEAGARLAEGYPVQPRDDGRPSPPASSYTGTVAMFARAGFAVAAKSAHAKVRMRRALGPRPRR
jgi:GNAT superfamily N-acetyltransferase